jgi:hypothetical protein
MFKETFPNYIRSFNNTHIGSLNLQWPIYDNCEVPLTIIFRRPTKFDRLPETLQATQV